MEKRTELRAWRETVLRDMSVMNAEALARKYDLSPCTARQWMAARESGRNINNRLNNYYNRLAEGWTRKQEITACQVWVYGMLDMLGGEMTTAEISRRENLRESQVKKWRIKLQEGYDLKPALRGYHYRWHLKSDRPRRLSRARADRDKGHRDDREHHPVISGHKCAMCGVWFSGEHGRAVVCRDCRKRPDFKPRVRFYNRLLILVEAWLPEV